MSAKRFDAPMALIVQRMLDRSVETDTGCWEFQGSRLKSGYGSIWRGAGRSVGYTHRVAYEYFIAEIPAGLDLDHLCRNRACCNPWHLEPVTRKVNANRGLHGSKKPQGLHTHCKRGHEFTPENTYVWVTPAKSVPLRNCKQCHRERQRATAQKARMI